MKLDVDATTRSPRAANVVREHWKANKVESLQYQMEHACRCLCSNNVLEMEDVSVVLTVGDEEGLAVIDMGAKSMWVDKKWFKIKGGQLRKSELDAYAADGNNRRVTRTGYLKFKLWGRLFTEDLKATHNLPSSMLIGMEFLRKRQFQMDMQRNMGFLIKDGHVYR